MLLNLPQFKLLLLRVLSDWVYYLKWIGVLVTWTKDWTFACNCGTDNMNFVIIRRTFGCWLPGLMTMMISRSVESLTRYLAWHLFNSNASASTRSDMIYTRKSTSNAKIMYSRIEQHIHSSRDTVRAGTYSSTLSRIRCHVFSGIVIIYMRRAHFGEQRTHI